MPAPGMAPLSVPMSEHDVMLRPIDTKRSKRGVVVGGAAVLAVAGVAAGAFMFVGGSDAPTDTVELATEATDGGIDTPASFSFAAATATAETAASVNYDMSMQTPEGPLTMDVTIDRASSRASMVVDMSQLEMEPGLQMSDPISMIIDESNGQAFMSAELFGELFGGTEAQWIQMDLDGPESNADGLEDLFSNPLDIAELFADFEPIDLGLETIDGEELQHFQVSIDPEYLAGLDETDLFGDVAEPDETQEVDAWVNEENQVRRLMFAGLDEGDPFSIDMWMEISTEPVDIQLPNPADVIDMNELMSNMFQDIDLGDIDLGDIDLEE